MLNVLELSGDLELSQASAIKQQLVERLKSSSEPLSISLRTAARIDTAIVQLLIAAKVQAPTTKVVDCSEEIIDYLERIGVTRLLL
jgi:anti-anti-sigma regulatory factor